MKKELHVVTTGTQSLVQLEDIITSINPYVDFIHLREKSKTAKELAELVIKLIERGVPKEKLILNDRVDVAFVLKVCGVQLAYHSLSASLVKQNFPTLRIGCSIHSLAEAKQVEKDGADYCLYGHVFETKSKQGMAPRGINELKKIIAAVNIPVIAIGGIKQKHIYLLKEVGVDGIAVMSGIFLADDPVYEAKMYQRLLHSGGEGSV